MKKQKRTFKQFFKRKVQKIKQFFKYFIFSKRNVFTWLWQVIKSLFHKGSIYTSLGAHLISGYMGSGKTLFANQIIQGIDKEKYFVISNIDEFNDVKTFNLNEIFYNGGQQKSFPTEDERGRKLWAVVFDEINLTFNRRMNRTKDYNEVFTGLVEFLVSSRHQNIPRVYFIGQKLELQDTQLQSLFKYQHDIIQTKRFPFYWFYKMFYHIEYIPRKLVIVNRVKSIDDEFIELNLDKVKILKSSLLSYNTKALGEAYASLPKANIS